MFVWFPFGVSLPSPRGSCCYICSPNVFLKMFPCIDKLMCGSFLLWTHQPVPVNPSRIIGVSQVALTFRIFIVYVRWFSTGAEILASCIVLSCLVFSDRCETIEQDLLQSPGNQFSKSSTGLYLLFHCFRCPWCSKWLEWKRVVPSSIPISLLSYSQSTSKAEHHVLLCMTLPLPVYIFFYNVDTFVVLFSKVYPCPGG